MLPPFAGNGSLPRRHSFSVIKLLLKSGKTKGFTNTEFFIKNAKSCNRKFRTWTIRKNQENHIKILPQMKRIHETIKQWNNLKDKWY